MLPPPIKASFIGFLMLEEKGIERKINLLSFQRFIENASLFLTSTHMLDASNYPFLLHRKA